MYLHRNRQIRIVLNISALLSLFFMVVLHMIDRHLITPATPAGIVSLELTGNTAVLSRILEAWHGTPLLWAMLSLGIDYAFILSYTSFLFLICMMLASQYKQRHRFISRAGIILGSLQPVAGLADMGENYFLIRTLLAAKPLRVIALARVAAVLKFILVSAAMFYLLVVLFFLLKERLRKKSSGAFTPGP